jgi:hypothetical protein
MRRTYSYSKVKVSMVGAVVGIPHFDCSSLKVGDLLCTGWFLLHGIKE